jgi:hypothetical protein
VARRGAVARGVPNLGTSSISPIGSENLRLIAVFHHLCEIASFRVPVLTFRFDFALCKSVSSVALSLCH